MNKYDLDGGSSSPKAGWVTWLFVALAGLGGAYAASPYLSLHLLRNAIIAGDAHAIEKRVDFVTVRAGLKEQVNLQMMKTMAKDESMKNNPFAGLAMALGPAMVDNIVDASVTADGIAHLIQQGKLKSRDGAGGKGPSADPAANVLNKGFAGYDDFEIEFVSGVKVWLRPEFPMSWRVYKVHIPVDS
jgi:hypothetical protein